MTWLNWAGILIAAISLLLVAVARMQLGESFSVTPKARDLVTNGLYRRLQNPMYVFVDLAICGIAMALHRWSVLLVLVILVPLQVRNTIRERQLLSARFEERYNAYRRSTWF